MVGRINRVYYSCFHGGREPLQAWARDK